MAFKERNPIETISLLISQNSILREFNKSKDNHLLLLQYLNQPSETNKERLNLSFKKIYFEIRFTAYITKIIHYYAFNFDKKYRIQQKRFKLVPDEDFNNLPFSLNTKIESQNFKIEDVISSVKLHNALYNLTSNEKEILSLSYIFNYSDTEISKIKYVSQQAISKGRTKALKKIRLNWDNLKE